MTLRLMVIVLLLANAMFWVWSRGPDPSSKEAPGSGPVAHQVRPEALAVRSLADVVAQTHAAASGRSAPGQPSADAGAPPVPAPTPVSTLPLPEPEEAEPDAEPEPQPPAPEAPADEPTTAIHPADAEAAPAPPAPEPMVEEARAPVPPVCWQAGPFNAAQAQQLREAAAALPAGSWQLRQTSDQAPRWMVYLGNMEDELAVLAKRSELQARGLDVDRAGAGFEPGLSLGRYSSREAADRALQMLSSQAGVSGARVVQERSEEATYFLRAESNAAGWRQRLQVLPLAGRALRRCGGSALP